MPPISDVDEIIETEVCNRLIRLSCAKMVNSKSERGGAKLHRNLLILHLLRKARDEQKRYPMFANGPDWMKGSVFTENPMMMLHAPNGSDTSALTNCTVSQYGGVGVNGNDDDDDEDEDMDDDDDVNGEIETTHLLDLSKNHESTMLNLSGGSGLPNQEQAEFDYSTLRLAPLQYTFAAPEMYGVSESTSAQHQQQRMFGEFATLPNPYFLEQQAPVMASAQTIMVQQAVEAEPGDQAVEEEDGEDAEDLAAPPSDGSECDSGCDCSTDSIQNLPVATESVVDDDEEEGEGSSSCSSEGGEEEDEEGSIESGCGRKPAPPPSSSSSGPNFSIRRRRKRKIPSAQRLPSPCTSAKKSCVEERQLTGLISVFNSGLTVVADQLTRPAASTVSSLHQQTPNQISPFMHIACNPLIC